MDIPWIIRNKVLWPFKHEELHEPNIQRLLLPIRGKVFWDVGANMGMYSLMLRKNFERIFAVEPNPTARRRLRTRIMWNRAFNVKVVPLALSDQNGTLGLEIGADRFHAQSKLSKSGLAIRTAAFDSVYQGEVDLMKIDVEGAEFLVLTGAKHALRAGRISKLLIELHSWDRESELERILSGYGYDCEWFRTNELHVFAQRPESQG